LYNKDDLISALLKKQLNDSFAHIRGLRDIKTLVFTKNPNFTEGKDDGDEVKVCPFICPVTSTEFNGIHPFVCIWTTSFVISDKAIKEIGIEALQGEYGPFTSEDIIRIIPNDEEHEIQLQAMVKRRALINAEKKSKKRKEVVNDVIGIVSDEVDHGWVNKRVHTITTTKLVSRISNTNSVVTAARESVEKQADASGVYKKLFHKDKEADKHGRDLFMSVAGLRYSVL
jgi:hypothetical protein